MSRPKIYLYNRISTRAQIEGTGLTQQRNQKPKLDKLSKEHGLPISNESFEDIGVSAYKGHHLQQSFGRILEAIRTGRIAQGSIIVVFSLDRISRQQVNLALESFLAVINRGVSIFTTSDNMLYDHNDEHISQNILLSVLTMQRAHEESLVKSKRTRGSALSIIKGIEENNPTCFKDGYTKAIKAVGTHPWWLDCSDGYVRPHKEFFPIAVEIVERLTHFHSTVSVVRWLKEEHSEYEWNHVKIDKMALNPLLTGKRTLNIDDQEYTINN